MTFTPISEPLAKAHWNYVNQLITIHNESPSTIAKIEFHYKSAMIHGFKHGADYILSLPIEQIKELKNKQ